MIQDSKPPSSLPPSRPVGFNTHLPSTGPWTPGHMPRRYTTSDPVRRRFPLCQSIRAVYPKYGSECGRPRRAKTSFHWSIPLTHNFSGSHGSTPFGNIILFPRFAVKRFTSSVEGHGAARKLRIQSSKLLRRGRLAILGPFESTFRPSKSCSLGSSSLPLRPPLLITRHFS